jgi:hypothetical protein
LALRSWTFAAASALALAATGCGPKPERALTRLDCPTTQGSLTRVSAAADGKSCLYRTAQGAEVRLRLVPVTGSVETTLAALETDALALRGPPPAAPATTPAASAQPAVGLHPDADADEDVDIDLPGLHIRTAGDSAKVRLGGLSVDAGDHGAEIRKAWDARLRGEAASTEKRGVRAFFLKIPGDEDPRPSVGYQAAGPKAGPIAAAIVKWPGDGDEDLYKDVRKLVRDNGGA